MRTILLKLNYEKKAIQKNNIEINNPMFINKEKKISDDFKNANTLNIGGWIFSKNEVFSSIK